MEADCFGTRLVHSAAQGGCIAIMEDLLERGHNLTAVNNTSRTCLHYAARGKHADGAEKACPVLLSRQSLARLQAQPAESITCCADPHSDA